MYISQIIINTAYRGQVMVSAGEVSSFIDREVKLWILWNYGYSTVS